MGSLTHTVGGTDNLVSFKSAARVPIDSLKVHFKPIQEGEGDPSPENVRPIRGWNGVEAYRIESDYIIEYIPGTTNSYNVTFVADGKGSVTATGTPTSYSSCAYGIIDVEGTETIYATIYGTLNNIGWNAPRLYNSNGDYISASLSDNILNLGLDLSQFPDVKKVRLVLKRGTNGVEMNGGWCAAVVGKNRKITSNNLPITFPVTGKNKFNSSDATNLTNLSYDSNTNTFTSTNEDTRSTLEIYCEGFSSTSEKVGSFFMRFQVPIGHFTHTFTVANPLFEKMNYLRLKHNGSKRDFSFFIPMKLIVGQTYTLSMDVIGADPTTIGGVSFKNIQFELGSEATEYEPYDPDNTFYGGYVDLVKGEIVQEYDIYTFTGDEKDGFIYSNTRSLSYDEVSERHQFNTTILDRIVERESTLDAYCNIGAPNLYYLGRKGSILYYIGTPSKQVSLAIDSSLCEPTIESFSQWLSEHPLQLVYKLATPVTYPLVPAQLAAFINVNNIWTNTNSATEVSYAVHDSAMIRDTKKRIVAASPHLETASGSLVNFNTDVAAPLKECKVEFKPKQDLHGYDKPWVGGTGKNLFNENAIIYGTWTAADGSVNSSSSPGCRTEDIAVNPGETYTAMYNGEQPYSSSLIELDENKNFIQRTHRGWRGSSNPSVLHVTLTENTRYIYLQVYHYNEGTMTKDVLSTYKMQLEKGSVATSYEPYENICPIEGFKNLEITRAGKNVGYMFNNPSGYIPSSWDNVDYNGISGISTEVATPSSFIGKTVVYSASVDTTQATEKNVLYARLGFWSKTEEKTWYHANYPQSQGIIDSFNGRISAKLLINTKDYYILPGAYKRSNNNIQIGLFQLEFGDEATDFEPYNGTTIPITFPSEAGTIYGGYVDLVNGEIVQTHYLAKVTKTQFGNVIEPSSGGGMLYRQTSSDLDFPASASGTDWNLARQQQLFNRGKIANPWSETNFGNNIGIFVSQNNYNMHSVRISEDLYQTLGDNDYVEISYLLAEPIHYPIDSQTLKTLRGTNNIWSTSNGPISIKYWKH